MTTIDRLEDPSFTGTLGNLDLILPPAFIPYEDHIKLSINNLTVIYGVLSFPSYLHIGYFDEIINEMKDKVHKVTYFSKISNKRAIDLLTDQIVVMGSNLKVKASDDDAALKKKRHDYEALRDLLQLNQEVLLQSVSLYKVSGHSLEDLRDHCNQFENLCDNLQVIVKTLIFDQEEAFKSMLPTLYMGLEEKKFKKNIDSGGFISLFAKGKSGLLHENGTFLGHMLDTGSPVIFDSFIGPPYLSNPMMTIFGIPGAGKSVAMKLIGKRANATSGDSIVYFDVEKESRKMVEDSGGYYVDIRPGVKSGFNPLDLFVTQEDGVKFVDLSGKIASIKDLLSVVSVLIRKCPLSGSEITTMEFVLRSMYQELAISEIPDSLYEERESDSEGSDQVFNFKAVKKKIFVLTDLRQRLEKEEATKELAQMMQLITGQGSMAMFDCETNVDFQVKHRITGIGYKKIRDRSTKVFAIMTMLNMFWSMFSDYDLVGHGKRILIDEGWELIRLPEILQILEEMARKGRKYWTQLILTTHFVDDLLRTNEGRAILELSSTKVIMQQNVDSVDRIGDYFALSDDIKSELFMFEPGNAIVLAGSEKFQMHFDVFDYEIDHVFT